MKKMLHQSIAGEKLDKELEKQMGTSPYKLTKKGTPRVEFYGATTKKEIQDEDYSEDEEDEEDDEEDNSDEESDKEDNADGDYEESDDSSDEESDEETSDEEDSDDE
jgi:hypothetical protein